MASLRVFDDITECCICRDSLVHPRMLPCHHIFCLKCLQKTAWYANKKSGDTLPCPICRREFLIPNPDFNGLDKKQNSRVQRNTTSRQTRDRRDSDHGREYLSTGFAERDTRSSTGLQTSRFADYILPVAVVVLAVGLSFFVISKGPEGHCTRRFKRAMGISCRPHVDVHRGEVIFCGRHKWMTGLRR